MERNTFFAVNLVKTPQSYVCSWRAGCLHLDLSQLWKVKLLITTSNPCFDHFLGMNQPSSSPTLFPVLFGKKKTGAHSWALLLICYSIVVSQEWPQPDVDYLHWAPLLSNRRRSGTVFSLQECWFQSETQLLISWYPLILISSDALIWWNINRLLQWSYCMCLVPLFIVFIHHLCYSTSYVCLVIIAESQ